MHPAQQAAGCDEEPGRSLGQFPIKAPFHQNCRQEQPQPQHSHQGNPQQKERGQIWSVGRAHIQDLRLQQPAKILLREGPGTEGCKVRGVFSGRTDENEAGLKAVKG